MRAIISSALSVSGIALMSALPQGEVVSEEVIPVTGEVTVEVPQGEKVDTNAANIGEHGYQHSFKSEEELEAKARALGLDLWKAVKSLEGHKFTQLVQIIADYMAFRAEAAAKLNQKAWTFSADAIKEHLIGTKDKVGILFVDVKDIKSDTADKGEAISKGDKVEKYPYLMNTLIPRAIKAAYLVFHGVAKIGEENNQLRVMMRHCEFEPNIKYKGKPQPNMQTDFVPLTADYIEAQYAHHIGGFTAQTVEVKQPDGTVTQKVVQVAKTPLDPYGKVKRDEKKTDKDSVTLKDAKVEDLADKLESTLGSVFLAVKDKPEQVSKLQENLEAVYDKVASVMGATLAVFVRKAIEGISRIPDTAADLKPDQFERAYGVTPAALQELRDIIRLKLGEATRAEVETMPVLALKEALSVKLADSTMLALTEEEQESLVQLTGLLETFTGANKARKAG